MSNSEAMRRRICAAALRVIASNQLSVVGRDGRVRFDVESVIAHGDLANLLRQFYGDIPEHDGLCAAAKSPICECDCTVRAAVEEIASA